MHVQQAIAAIKAKGLQEAYEKLVWAEKECNEKLKEAELNRDLTEIKGRDDSVLSKAIDKAKEAQTKAKSAVVHVASSMPMSSRKKQGSHGIKAWQSKLTAIHGRT